MALGESILHVSAYARDTLALLIISLTLFSPCAESAWPTKDLDPKGVGLFR